MAYQSLYRRYRPRRFDEVVAQQHVVTALRNAVREGRSGHAYLFSGPRGTGKTSIARILAKALNCTEGADGEPCGRCESCLAMDGGTSYDLHELDAASNNGVDAMRDLIAKAALGSPGRTKVYILDEVHMLSTAASNALLKTLEEPPPHVTFVLATTDPQKVLPTIRSRAQHFEFGLIPAVDLEAHVRRVMADAGIDLDDDAVSYVVRKGAGSARDTLSVLDQVAALGDVLVDGEPLDDLLEALVARSTAGALSAVADALQSGREPRLLGEQLLARLRDAFLVAVGAPVGHLPTDERARVGEAGRRMGPAALTRALEALGEALVEMRQAPDPRVPLEVALVRVTRPELDTSLAALVERVASLERQLAGATATAAATASSAATAPAPLAASVGGPPARPSPEPDAEAVPAGPLPAAAPPGGTPGPSPPPGPSAGAAGSDTAAPPGRRRGAGPPGAQPGNQPSAPAPAPAPAAASAAAAGVPAASLGPAAEARRRLQDRLGATRPPGGADTARAAPASASGPTGPSATARPGRPQPPAPASSSSGEAPPAGVSAPGDSSTVPFPAVDELSRAWVEVVLDGLAMPAKARFRAGRFLATDGELAIYGLPNGIHRDRCEEKRNEVEAALGVHFGRPIPLRLVVDTASGPGPAGGLPGRSGGAPPLGSGGAPVAPPDDDESLDLADVHALPDASDVASTVVDRLMQAFPGSQVLE